MKRSAVPDRKALKPSDLLSLEDLAQAAECLRTIAHPHRLRIIEILLRTRLTVGEIAALCGIAQPAASLHLRLLQSKGLLGSQRAGRKVYYLVCEAQLAAILQCVRALRPLLPCRHPRPPSHPSERRTRSCLTPVMHL